MKSFLLCFLFLSPAIINAQLEICNDTDETLSVAIKYYDKSNSHWASIGWYIFSPNECEYLLDNLSNYSNNVYLVGRISSGQFSGNYSFCVQNKAFEYTETDEEVNSRYCYDPYMKKGAFLVNTYASIGATGKTYTFSKNKSNYSKDKSGLELLLKLLNTPSNNNRSSDKCVSEKCSNCYYAPSHAKGKCYQCDDKRYYCTTHDEGYPHY